MTFFTSATTISTSGNKDVEVAEPPTDSISSLSFSTQADYLAAGSWDNNVRIYEVRSDGKTEGRAMYAHQGPVLSVCWNKEGNKVFSGGADNAARMLDITTGQSQQVAQHDAPVKVVRWIDSSQGGILATGSWDKTIKYWDLRASAPVASVQLPERCYTFDVRYPLMVVGTADRHIQIYDLANPTTPYKTIQSPLKWQTRVITCFSNSTANTRSGFAVGSVEGRVAIQYIDEKDGNQNFSFRCHRRDSGPNKSLVFPVNDIVFHPVHGTFATCGSDGVTCFWDKDSRTRLKTFDQAGGPVTSTSFNRNGTILAYSISYDWFKGHSGMTPGHPNKIMLHACKDDELKKKPRK